jgi:hypothetical protein
VVINTITGAVWASESGNLVDWQGNAYEGYVTEPKPAVGTTYVCERGTQPVTKDGGMAYCCSTKNPSG